MIYNLTDVKHSEYPSTVWNGHIDATQLTKLKQNIFTSSVHF